ncbi:MAG: PadR family transcriptional regulator [Candidatus Acidiferrum sp.]
MSQKSSGVVQGTLDMLILKTVALEPLHGYGVGLRIEQISKGVFRINAGSLFPAFRRLERQGLIKGEWRATENNRHAKYYMLTDEGRKKLKAEAREWQTQSVAIARILEATSGEL